MTDILLETSISPAYGQIVVKDDALAVDVPDFYALEVTGEEAVVASSQVIHVFTIPDHVGDVRVCVTRTPPSLEDGARLVLDQSMNFSSGRLAVTTVEFPNPGESDAVVQLGVPGWIRTRVYVAGAERPTRGQNEGTDQPDRVWVVIGG